MCGGIKERTCLHCNNRQQLLSCQHSQDIRHPPRQKLQMPIGMPLQGQRFLSLLWDVAWLFFDSNSRTLLTESNQLLENVNCNLIKHLPKLSVACIYLKITHLDNSSIWHLRWLNISDFVFQTNKFQGELGPLNHDILYHRNLISVFLC